MVRDIFLVKKETADLQGFAVIFAHKYIFPFSP